MNRAAKLLGLALVFACCTGNGSSVQGSFHSATDGELVALDYRHGQHMLTLDSRSHDTSDRPVNRDRAVTGNRDRAVTGNPDKRETAPAEFAVIRRVLRGIGLQEMVLRRCKNIAYKRRLFTGFHYYYKPLHELLLGDAAAQTMSAHMKYSTAKECLWRQ